MRNIFITWVALTALMLWWAYAADTIIQNIAGLQTSDTEGTYGNRAMTIGDGDLKFINLDGNADIIGDYFSGHYYDPAFGIFEINSWISNRLKIIDEASWSCPPSHTDKKLEWFSYSPNFGHMDFSHSSYICIPNDATDNTLNTYIWWYAYSSYIGFQSLSGILLDSSVDFSIDHDAEWKYIKVEGVVASEKNTELLDQFDGDLRVLGELTKSTFRKDIHQKVYPVISNLQVSLLPDPYTIPSNHLWESSWPNTSPGTKILNDKGLYFRDTEIRLGWQSNIEWNKTLVVEGANIYITGNITNADNDGILWIIALQKDGVGGNIYIDPTVTDIHAVMYADRSLMSYNGTNELDGSTSASSLANQLYIFGSVFSENTIGSSQNTPAECPYYVASSDCTTQNEAMQYDLNFLRKYILVQPVDASGDPVGDKIPQFSWVESQMWDSSNTNTETQKPGYRKYPVIIEYDPSIQQSPPPFFN